MNYLDNPHPDLLEVLGHPGLQAFLDLVGQLLQQHHLNPLQDSSPPRDRAALENLGLRAAEALSKKRFYDEILATVQALRRG